MSFTSPGQGRLLLLVLTAVLVVGATPTAAAADHPLITVDPVRDEFWASGFDPWTILEVHIGPDEFWTSADSTGSVYLDLYGLHDIQAGQFVTVTGDVGTWPETVSFTVSHLQVWPLWPEAPAGIYQGTADPNSTVCLTLDHLPEDCIQADGTGYWTHSLGKGAVAQYENGHTTRLAVDNSNTAWVGVNRAWNKVRGAGFLPNTPVQIYVNGTWVAAFQTDRDTYFSALLNGAAVLHAGDEVLATDGIATKQVTVSATDVTKVDPDLDTVEGTGAPGTRIIVGVLGVATQELTIGSEGTWVASFSGVYDICCGTSGGVSEYDLEDDSNHRYWQYAYVGPPWVTADGDRIEVVEGSLATMTGQVTHEPCAVIQMSKSGPGTLTDNGDGTWQWQWPNPVPGSFRVTVWASDGSEDVSTGFDVVVAAGPHPLITVDPTQDQFWVEGFDPWAILEVHIGPDEFWTSADSTGSVYLDLYGLHDIQAGQFVTVTGDVGTWPETVGFTVSNLEVWPAWSETPGGLIEGTADPGSEVCVTLSHLPGEDCVVADEEGYWAHLVGAGSAAQYDDGHATRIDFDGSLQAFFLAAPFDDGVWGHWFRRSASVDVYVNGGWVATFPTDRSGYWGGSVTLTAGDEVLVTDGIATKTTTVTNVAVTSLDPDLDTVGGVGDPGAQLLVGIHQTGVGGSLVIGEDASWLVHFATDFLPAVGDICCGTTGWVHDPDEDGDITATGFSYIYHGPPWVAADADTLAVIEGDVATMTGTLIDEPCTDVWIRVLGGPGTVVDRGDGTWAWEWADTVAGEWRVTIEVNDGAAPAFAWFQVNVAPRPPFLPISIDIKPGSYPNSINLGANGNVPVAILTTAAFDAAGIAPATVRFAGTAALRWSMEDADRDGDLDMVLHFATRALELDSASTVGVLTGQTLTGLAVEGSDSVRIVKGKPVQ